MELGELFTRQWAVASGTTDRDLTRAVRSGRVTRVARGVYRVGAGHLPDPEAIAKSLKVVLSYQSAAAWSGASLVKAPDRLHVTAGRSRGRRADELPGVRVHRADLPPGDLVRISRVLLTAGVRTGLDIARALPLEESVATLDSMARIGFAAGSDIHAAALALPRGPGRVLAVTASALVDPRAESVFESLGRVRLAVAGLPAPEPQYNVFDRDGHWIARVDFAWPRQRVLLECDGYEYHKSREAFERDRRRWTALTRAGWKVVVVTWRGLMEDPSYLVDVMSDLLA
jgi:hypothetical protein